MAAAKKKPTKPEKPKAGTTAPKAGLGLRLKAWWEGYDVEALLAIEAAKAPDQSTTASANAAQSGDVPEIDDSMAPEHHPGDVHAEAWSAERVDVGQMIWGKGYCGPGGPEHIISMCKLLVLTPQMSMMHLGAGMGGPARTLADHFGVWVTGYSAIPELVEAGNELSMMAGLAKKAELKLLDPTAKKYFDRKYDRALLDGFLLARRDKKAVIAQVQAAVKTDGYLLITDYFLNDQDDIETDVIQAWMGAEPKTIYPCSGDEMQVLLERAGFKVRVNEDRSTEHVGHISEAWSGADKVVASLMANPEEAHLVTTLVNEAELWNRRAAAVASGHLRFRRLLAAK